MNVGGVQIGGGAPVVVQTMTKTETANLSATMEQIRKVADAGADIVRVAVPRDKDIEALKTIVVESPIPIIADIHFNHTLALKAIDAGAHCIRLNPGNIGGPEKVAEVADRARAAGTPMRIGVNSGSLPKHLHALERENSVEALVTAGAEFVALMERLNFTDFKVSIKSTNVPNTIAANRLLSERIPYPLHLGITEAGTKWSGSLKSAVGLGTLLADGIGDTIRISLSTFHAEEEVKVAWEILKALKLRERGPVLIACPTCGRLQFDMDTVVADIERRLEAYEDPVEVAVLGCAVNGIGEASHADFGITGAKNEGLIFSRGKPLKKVPQERLVDELFIEIDKYAQTKRIDVTPSSRPRAPSGSSGSRRRTRASSRRSGWPSSRPSRRGLTPTPSTRPCRPSRAGGSRGPDAQQGSQLRTDGVRLVPQPSPRDPYDPVAGDGQCRILAPVALEAPGCAVVLVAVHLDDQALGRPESVDLPARHAGVHPRQRQPGRLAQRFQPLLALGARELREALFVGDHEAEDVRLLGGAVELVGGERSRQVLEGAGGGGEGQAVVNGGIEGGGAVDSEAGAGAASRRCGDVDLATSFRESPYSARTLVAQHRAVAAREHRRHLATPTAECGPDLEHAAVQRHKPAGLDSPRDRAPADPGIEELRGRDDPVLPGRERHDGVHFVTRAAVRPVRVTLRTLVVRFVTRRERSSLLVTKCTLGRHGPEHPTGTPGPTPSMPQLIRRRYRFATKRRCRTPSRPSTS